jgi:hypothetical protein
MLFKIVIAYPSTYGSIYLYYTYSNFYSYWALVLLITSEYDDSFYLLICKYTNQPPNQPTNNTQQYSTLKYYCPCLVTLAMVEGSYHLSRSRGGGSLSSLRQRLLPERKTLPMETRSRYTYCNSSRQKPVTTTPYSTLRLHIMGTILYARAPADRWG